MRVQTVAALAVAASLTACGGDRQAHVLPVRVPAEIPIDGHATAFAIGDGQALTVAHVLRARRPVLVGGRRARVVRSDTRLDVAVLAVPGLDGPNLSRGRARAGQRLSVRVLRDGAVHELGATVLRTITARLDGRDARPALELTAAVMPGDSGAPVVDEDGRVVAMVFAVATDRENLTYALDLRALRTP